MSFCEDQFSRNIILERLLVRGSPTVGGQFLRLMEYPCRTFSQISGLPLGTPFAALSGMPTGAAQNFGDIIQYRPRYVSLEIAVPSGLIVIASLCFLNLCSFLSRTGISTPQRTHTKAGAPSCLYSYPCKSFQCFRKLVGPEKACRHTKQFKGCSSPFLSLCLCERL